MKPKLLTRAATALAMLACAVPLHAQTISTSHNVRVSTTLVVDQLQVRIYALDDIALQYTDWGSEMLGEEYFCVRLESDDYSAVTLEVQGANPTPPLDHNFALQREGGDEQLGMDITISQQGGAYSEIYEGQVIPLYSSAADCSAADQSLDDAQGPLRISTRVRTGTTFTANGQSPDPVAGTYSETLTLIARPG